MCAEPRLAHVRHGLALGALILMIFGCGCATVPYQYGRNLERGAILELAPGEAQFERGRPEPLVDGLRHYLFSLPSKLLLLNWRVDYHTVSPATEAKLVQYLADNELRHVKVRLNQYAPGAEWRRLFRNRGMHGFWRYTFGVVSMVYYTIMPGRLFGGDHYNPFSNTVNLYSDHPAIALHEGAHAKDFMRVSRGWRGPYAIVRMLPLVPLYQEAVATGDAIGYDRATRLTADEKAAYKVLYPAYATYIMGELPGIWSGNQFIDYAIAFAGTIPAHILGRIKAAGVEP